MTPRPIMAILDKVESRKDNTWMIRIATNELHDDDVLHLNKCVNKQGYFYFAEAPFSQIEIPVVQLGEFENKSKSETLRAVIWRIWEANGKKGEFKTYYDSVMDKIIDQLKERLN